MNNILNIRNLSKEYEDFKLDNISFSIPKGVIMGLVGENGAGKTTTIKSILNLIKTDSGDIEILGLDNKENELEIKQRIGVVLDESYFHDNLKILDISRIMKNIYKSWDEKLFLSYIDKFKLSKNKIVKDFSKGMKMKLSIAVALGHNPIFLILDEPTGGLDPIVRNEILDMFLEFIQDEEKSILFSTHITSDLDKIADYITFIHNGKLIFTKEKNSIENEYGIVKCGLEDLKLINQAHIIGKRKNKFGYEVLVNDLEEVQKNHRNLIIDRTNLENIMLFYIKGENK